MKNKGRGNQSELKKVEVSEQDLDLNHGAGQGGSSKSRHVRSETCLTQRRDQGTVKVRSCQAKHNGSDGGASLFFSTADVQKRVKSGSFLPQAFHTTTRPSTPLVENLPTLPPLTSNARTVLIVFW